MRPDFPKLLVECYKAGANRNPGHGKPVRNDNVVDMRRTRIMTDEDGDLLQTVHLPKSLGMRQKGYGRNYGTKSFGENLAPLVRWLKKQVGRPWDRVYGEMKKSCPSTGAVNTHIYTHVWDYVELNVVMLDGKPHASNGTGPIESREGSTYKCMYVNPSTGILCKSPTLKRREAQPKDGVDSEFMVCREGVGVWVSKIDPITGAKQWFRLLSSPERWDPIYKETGVGSFLSKKGFRGYVDIPKASLWFGRIHKNCYVGGMMAENPPGKML